MKKFFALLIALMMVLSLAACSGSGEPEEFVPARGTVEDGIYKNEAFGIGFKADSDWYFYSDEEIASSMGKTVAELFPEDFAENLESTEIIYDIYGADYYTGSTISINFENTIAVYEGEIDEESYLEIVKSQIETTLSGMEILRNEIGTTSVSGKEVPCLFVEIGLSGTTVYEAVIAKKAGSWIGVITLASVTEDGLPLLLENLSFE